MRCTDPKVKTMNSVTDEDLGYEWEPCSWIYLYTTYTKNVQATPFQSGGVQYYASSSQVTEERLWKKSVDKVICKFCLAKKAIDAYN